MCLISTQGLLPAYGLEPQAGEAASPAERRAVEEFFEAEVRPLLVKHCVDCHGPDDQSGELRLDRKSFFAQGGGSGPVVQAGNPAGSLLIRAIGYQDNALQMPPDSKLSAEAIATLESWVLRGAYWPDETSPAAEAATSSRSVSEEIEYQRKSHWSYQPIKRPKLPAASSIAAGNQQEPGRDERLTPIDLFVRDQLASAGLSPNPTADRRALIERAYFVLIGLPPTHEEVMAFERDRQPDAFPRLVERLLANPHYGERWARHWLDLARYGDTMGYLAGSREERYPFAFTYRDYVIKAFNSDKPYDDFLREQLAADKLESAGEDRSSLAAMGYLTVGRKFMNRQHDIIDDQIDVVTRGMLGLSVSCARCHDHKYDPIPTADYYSLYGVFASSREPDELPLLGPPQPSAEYQAFLEAKAAKQQKVDTWLEERRVETEDELRSRVGDYLLYAAEQLPAYRREGQKPFQGRRGPLRRAAVRNWQQFLIDPNSSPHAVWQLFRELAKLPAESFPEQASELITRAAAVKGSGQSEDESSSRGIPERVLAALQERPPQAFPEAAQIYGEILEEAYQQWKDANSTAKTGESQDAEPPDVGVSDADLPNADLQEKQELQTAQDIGANDRESPDEAEGADSQPQQLAVTDDQLLQLLLDPDSPTSLDREGMIAHLDQAQRNKYNQLLNEVNGVEVTHPGAPPRGMVLVDKPTAVEPVIFRRGEPSNRGEPVPRRFLQVLSHVDGGQPFQNGSGRLELAEAITDTDNPLTARVIVNRLWQHHFGQGLVRTPSDFGVRGEPPTHPQLLDYLASELINSGWSIKHIQREIMLSATWQQSSVTRSEAMQVDPENRLLWHMPRQRLEFEVLRDRLLSAAGRLDGRVGGRSVMIHEDATRRGLYAYIDREDFPGLLASFDVPSPDASRAQRAQTTVPQQALYLMNSAFVIEQARAIAKYCNESETSELPLNEASDEGRIKSMFRRTLAREPAPSELDAALQFVHAEARNPIGEGEEDKSPSPHESDESKQNAGDSVDRWVQLAQVLMLSNEFSFVD